MHIHVGTGNTLYENEIISASRTVLELHRVFLNDIVAVSISTTSSNNGYWRFNIPATGIQTTFFQRNTISMAISVTDAPTQLLTKQVSALKTQHLLKTDFVPSTHTATDTQALPHTNSATSNIALKTIPFTRRTDFRFGISQRTFSELSDNLSTLASSIYITISTDKDSNVNHKMFLDTPENVAVIGLLISAGGIGAICTVAYLMKKRCKNVSVASGRAVDGEENNQDSEENVAY